MCCKIIIICENIRSDQALFIPGSELRFFVYILAYTIHFFFQKYILFTKAHGKTDLFTIGISTCTKYLGYKVLLCRQLGAVEVQDLYCVFQSKHRQ